MKKITRLLVIVFALMMIFTLSACSGGNDSKDDSKNKKESSQSKEKDKEKDKEKEKPAATSLEGVFKLTHMKMGDTEIDETMLDLIEDEEDGMVFNIEFRADGTFTLTVPDEELSGTFTVDGNSFSLMVEDSTEVVTGTIDGDTVNIADEDEEMEMSMTFTKQPV